MNYPERVKARELRGRMGAADAPLLVLAYEDETSFRTYGVEGAVPFSEFQARLPGMSRDQEVIFYCA
jgi:hypothetical protein